MPLGAENIEGKEGASGDETQDYSGSKDTGVSRQLSQVLEELHIVNRRLDRLEFRDRRPVSPPFEPREISPPNNLRANSHSKECADPEGPASSASLFSPTDNSVFNEIQEKFNVIKSSVEKVILPTHLKLHDSRSGIKRDDQPVLNVVGKCGRYIETALKLISDSDEGKEIDVGQIAVVLVANLKFLQDEFAALLVKGRFDNNTSQLFRSLQKSNSGFDEHSLQNVRVAAELSSIANRYPPRQNRGEYRGRGRGRGDRDMFQPFRGSGFPRFRGQQQNRDRDQEDS